MVNARPECCFRVIHFNSDFNTIPEEVTAAPDTSVTPYMFMLANLQYYEERMCNIRTSKDFFPLTLPRRDTNCNLAWRFFSLATWERWEDTFAACPNDDKEEEREKQSFERKKRKTLSELTWGPDNDRGGGKREKLDRFFARASSSSLSRPWTTLQNTQ